MAKVYNINEVIPGKHSPLSSALMSPNCNNSQLEKLLAQGANPLKVDGLGACPLIVTIDSRDQEKFNLLLREIPEAVSIHSPYKLTPILMHAIRVGATEMVKKLLHRCPDISYKNEITGLTPLHAAILTGNLQIVKLVVDHRADVNALNSQGSTPLHTAIVNTSVPEHIKICKYLIAQGADVNIVDALGHTALFWMANFISTSKKANATNSEARDLFVTILKQTVIAL